MTKESSKKNWRGKVAKQWKRMQGSSSASNTSYPEGGSIGKSNHFIILLLKVDFFKNSNVVEISPKKLTFK